MSNLTIDEAIKHCLEVAEGQEQLGREGTWFEGEDWNEKARAQCRECAAEHRQLAEWLTELRDRQWVSVNERLPEIIDNTSSKDVLIQLKNGEQYVAIYIGEDKDFGIEAYWATSDMHRHFECDKVTHWQPCPKSIRTEVIDNEH